MGHGTYSSVKKFARSKALGYDKKAAHEIFEKRALDIKMNPDGVTLRESRDSADHPNSLPVVLALDVTGSMGSIPHFLVKEGLPHMMDKIIEGGVPDPQVLFLGVGDHECDCAPLQVGQFESCDELLDKWLTNLWIEGGGGGNSGESYHLAWFFAGRYTETDHFQKRGQKGILITIGDEPVLKSLPALAQTSIMGTGQEDLSAADLLEKAREQYEVFHLHISQGYHGRSEKVKDGWKQLMGPNVYFVQGKEEVASVITEIVLDVDKAQKDTGYALSPPPPAPPIDLDEREIEL